ncbi:MAG: protein serine/threonine phosphatase 2C family protein [Bacilli bacterium]|nr:protein serine/threonine phosphatase 2C family protein [Bacilli bacterium]
MNYKKELNKMLIGYKIKHPNEDIEQVLSNIILRDNIYEYFEKKENFFKINKNLKNINFKKEIIKIMYETWCSFLDDYDYFSFSKNYVIFIKDKKINIVGHIDIEDLKYLKSTLLENIENKREMQAVIYPIYAPGVYKIDEEEIEIDERGKIKTNYKEVEYGKIEERNTKYIFKREKIYFLTKKYLKGEKINDNDFEEIVKTLSKEYIKTIDINEVLKENGFTILNTFKILSNLKLPKLEDKASGKLLEGKIDLSIDRGYQTHPERPQQDTALSIVKDENIFLNIIADGAGGSENGEKASITLVNELKEWFEIIPNELFDHIEVIIELLKQKIIEIDKKIEKNYKKSYTTFVLALTIGDKTIIANIGDSQAYTYDNNELIALTTLDSESIGMSYEDARFNPWNNIITAAVGDGYKKDIHINIIDNKGQKIILSSDGVTDLISEERFKTYFTNDIDSSKIVDDSLSKKDTEWLDKDEDNISVIIINLPNYKQKRLVK